MTSMINKTGDLKTTPLLIEILRGCHGDESVQFLTAPGLGKAVVQRLRVALSRSRNRNKFKGNQVALFTMNHSIYPYTDKLGIRHDCIVISMNKTEQQRQLELLDDLMGR